MIKNSPEVLAAALSYVALGWKLFPLHSVDEELQCTCGKKDCQDAGKHPRVRHGLKDALDDPMQIAQWFGPNGELSNIGLVTGSASGITVVDIDIGDGKFGAETWAAIVSEHGEPVTLMCRTGSGGMHLFFQYNSVVKTASNYLGKGIDTRNDGGYVVAAPSHHRSGGFYEWLNWPEKGQGGHPINDLGSALASLPAHLAARRETRGRPRKEDMYRGKYSIEQVRGMLEFIEPSDRDLWRSIGVILGREFKTADDAWELYNTWSDRWGGTKGRNHNEIMHEAFYEISQKSGDKELTIGTIVKGAIDGGWAPKAGEVPVGNFVFYGPGNNYVYRPTCSFWIAPAVDAACSPVNENGKIIKASEWLKANHLVTSMTSTPASEEDVLKGVDCRNGELLNIAGAATYNTYRRPTIELGDHHCADIFVAHCRMVFNKPGDCDQFLDYMAHRVQRPWEKPRFALLLAGDQGVGKDTAVEFCVPAIGSWNVANIEPSALDQSFNEYVSSTLVRISEAANLHEMSKWAFNEKTKVLIAGSPDDQTINPKYGHKYSVKMFCGVIITTNHLTSGIFIPEGDRRYDVISCATFEEMGLFTTEARREYFSELWDWFLDGGDRHVAAYLHTRPIDGFSASNGQRKTEAHKDVVVSGKVNDFWLQDVLDEIENITGPLTAFRSDWLIEFAERQGEMKKSEIKGRLTNAAKRIGLTIFRNELTPDGRHRFGGKKSAVYRKEGVPVVDLEPLKRELF